MTNISSNLFLYWSLGSIEGTSIRSLKKQWHIYIIWAGYEFLSYHKFSNLLESFSSDFNNKLMAEICSINFLPEVYDCHSASKVNVTCPFKSNYRHTCLIYHATCRLTSRIYIGSDKLNTIPCIPYSRYCSHGTPVPQFSRRTGFSVVTANDLSSCKFSL